MKSKRRSARRPSAPAIPVFDDGIPVDPYWNGSGREGRKAKQLCRQVAQTLDLVLSGDCRDELLQCLHVLSVVPAPNSSRLLVVVKASLPEAEFDRAAIMAELESQSGRLRAEVATAIHRKRVPILTFHVVGPTWVPEAG